MTGWGKLGEKTLLRLLSMLFAAMLWLFVTLHGEGEAEIPLVIRPVNVPSGLSARVEQLSHATVRISGARILLMRQRMLGAVACLDLSGGAAGRIEFSSPEKYVRLEEGLRARYVSPGRISIFLESTN